jgi:hypothetical protein
VINYPSNEVSTRASTSALPHTLLPHTLLHNLLHDLHHILLHNLLHICILLHRYPRRKAASRSGVHRLRYTHHYHHTVCYTIHLISYYMIYNTGVIYYTIYYAVYYTVYYTGTRGGWRRRARQPRGLLRAAPRHSQMPADRALRAGKSISGFDRLRVGWPYGLGWTTALSSSGEGHKTRRCRRVTYPESDITKYTKYTKIKDFGTRNDSR